MVSRCSAGLGEKTADRALGTADRQGGEAMTSIEVPQSTGLPTVHSELQRNALGLPGVLMQGIATISPAFSQLGTFTATVALAAIVSPLAFVIGGAVLAIQALCTAQLAREFPSAGGWYTWIARTVHPRAGFYAGWIFSIWLPPAGVLTLCYLGKAVLQPGIQAYYGVTIPWWVYPIVGIALVAFWSYRGIKVSERLLLITGGVEILIMVALAITGLVHPGKGGFSFAPLNPGNFGKAPDVFLAIVFAVFAYSGWESIGPLAEESRNPRRYVPYALVGAVIILMVFEFLATWGFMVGIGVDRLHYITTAVAWPVATMAQHVWEGAWVILLLALMNSALAVSLGSFNGATRTWFGMGRSGVLPKALGRVSPSRRTPVNAIHLELVICGLAFLLAAVFGVDTVFFTWAIAITLALIIMYIICDSGVIKYYLTAGRDRFNPVLHLILPIVSIVAVGYVGYKSIVPLPPPPEKWAPVVLGVYFVLGAAVLVYLKVRGNEEWLVRAQMAMEEDPQTPASPAL